MFRWPGYKEFWYKLAQLRFLDEKPIQVGDVWVSPRAFLHALLEPQLQYSPKERDIIFIHIEIKGIKNGKQKHLVYQLADEIYLSLTRIETKLCLPKGDLSTW